MDATEVPSKPHHGHNMKRIREILGVKQDALAHEMGGDWNQRKISLLEQKEVIEDAILEEVSKGLQVTPEAIKNFNEESTVHIIASNHNGKDQSSAVNFQCTFNPLEKYVEQVEENKKLYEALLKSEREKIALLEKMLGKKSK